MRKQKEFADFLILSLKKLEQKYQATVNFHDVTQAFFRNPFFQKGLMPMGYTTILFVRRQRGTINV